MFHEQKCWVNDPAYELVWQIQGMYMSSPGSKKVLVTFSKEVATGSLIFLIIAAGAVVLGLVLNFLKSTEADPVVLAGLYFAKYLLFAVDLILFTRFIFVTASKVWRVL